MKFGKRISRFNRIARNNGLKLALYAAVTFVLNKVGLGFEYRNAIQFNDLRLAVCCDIKKKLPPSTQIPHPVGIIIPRRAEIGDNVRILQNVTLGKSVGEKDLPTIDDNVIIYSGAVILGDVTIGEGAVIGANSVVLHDVPEDTTVVGSPATEIN